MHRYHYLLTMSVATLLGFLGGPLLARYLLSIASPTLSYYLQSHDFTHMWTVLSLQVWTPASRVLLIIFFLKIGQQAHQRFELAAEMVYSHTLAFYRWRNQVCTPGTVFDYLIWAYTYATVRAITGLATFVGVLIIPPCLLAGSYLWRAVLLIPFFFFAIFMSGHVVAALDRIYSEIPKRLQSNLRIFGYLIDYFLAIEREKPSPPDNE